MISLDTETTGIDFYHGAKPYFVTICRKDGSNAYWEFPVDPLTREPRYAPEDIDDIQLEIANADLLVLQNTKFDYTALHALEPRLVTYWDWGKVRDTVIADHILASMLPHGLDALALRYLKEKIDHHENALEKCVQECRRLCRSKFKDWAIAKAGRPDMPSAGEATWKYDCWLPAAVALELSYPDVDPVCTHLWGEGNLCTSCGGHFYWVALRQYANKDSEVTLGIWLVMERELERRGLMAQYLDRLKLLPIQFDIEHRGVTTIKPHMDEMREEYQATVDECERVCTGLAMEQFGYALDMPKGNRSNNLQTFCFDVLKLPVLDRTDTGQPSMDKYVMEDLENTLEPGTAGHIFVSHFRRRSARVTSLSYMDAYERFWLPLPGSDNYHVLHPQLNPTGTRTTRWSCKNPNEQNIAKRGVDVPCPRCRGNPEGCDFCKGKADEPGYVNKNLRYGFGPAPGREWWFMDGENLELRIPAYGAGEKEMIGLFEEKSKPPYFGSNHLLNFHTIYPELWEEGVKAAGPDKAGKWCKEKYADTWYQWCKNGGFAVLYGAVDRPDGGGTADLAFRKRGAHKMLKERFARMEAYNQRWIKFAERHGYVETMPRKHVDPAKGYPLMCKRTRWNKVLPTVPLNYHVQGTACLWMQDAMIWCHEQLEEWRRESRGAYDGFITMQVHDELVFDLPKRADPRVDPRRSNLARARVLQRLMERGGEMIGVPTTVSCKYAPVSWDHGIAL